jgi:hypothetical protein
MSNFKFQKTFLAVSATAAMAGMLVGGQAFAQIKNEQGSIEITAKIITATCVLDLGGTASTTGLAAKKILDLGSLTVANVSALTSGYRVGKQASVVVSLKESTGGAGCAALGTGGKWDVVMDLPTTAYNAADGTINNTTTTADAANSISAAIFTQVGSAAVAYPLGSARSPIGILLSGSQTGPNLLPTDIVTVSVQMFRVGSGAVTAGAYTASVPLTVVYK